MTPITTTRAPTSKIALGGALLLVVYVVLCSWATTQWLGHKFGYQAALGERGALGLYGPLDWLRWLWLYYRQARETFGAAAIGFTVASSLGAVAYVLSVGFFTRSIKQHAGLHGTAHWATLPEIRASGLLPPPGQPGAGVYVGAWRDPETKQLHYLRDNGPSHVAAIAPTRSGKGVGLVVPTLLSWPHSCVVHDQKGELWAMTAGWRQRQAGNLVLKFDPAAAEGSIAFNPLDEVRVGTVDEVADAQNIATIIVDPDGKGMTDHWSKTAHALLTGLILHLQYRALEQGRTATLPEVAAVLSDPNRPVSSLYDEMLANKHIIERDAAGTIVGRRTHPTVASAARDMLNRAENERSGVLSTTMSFLTIYRDPKVAKNVSRSDFKISDLMNHVKVTEQTDPATGEVTETRTPIPVSLYLVIRAEDKDRLRPLMRLVINQIVRVLLRPELRYVGGRELPPHLTRLLLMIDEFPSFGRLDVLQEALAYIAGYGMKAYLIMQDVSQLQAIYGRDESILSNCHIRIAYAPNKIETGKWLSENSGVTTVITERITTSGNRFGALLQNVSRSYAEGSRPLITPDEAMRLKSPEKDRAGNIISAGEVLVFAAGHSPIRGEQSLYFVNPTFASRVQIAPPALSDRIERPAPGVPGDVASPAAASPPGGFGAFLSATRPAAAPVATGPTAPVTASSSRTRRAQVHRALREATAAGAGPSTRASDPGLPFEAMEAEAEESDAASPDQDGASS